jgi:class 3 adenylate cyclase
MIDNLEVRLKGSPKKYIIEELFTNSIHFPLANVILEFLLRADHPTRYFGRLDPYIILFACLIQAYFLGMWRFRGKAYRLLGNLIGPTLYMLFEFIVEGMEFFESPNHLAYWGFSFTLGLLQEIEYHSSGLRKNLLILAEHLVRTNILLVTYWIFEASDLKYATLPGFFSDHSHQYIAIVLFLLGMVIGFANISANNYLQILRQTARILEKYSAWFFGRELLSQAVLDSSVLSLQRRERTVMFMDIRGFTSWSETKSPEEVVTMLNAYFYIAEQLWQDAEPIKVKHTGDEILAVFAATETAVTAAIRLRDSVKSFLQGYGLSAGIGIHSGELVEGLIGSENVKAYDIIGDTVNTGKRICDQATGNEILISQACYMNVRDRVAILEPRAIHAKGKKEAIQVYPIQRLTGEFSEEDGGNIRR